MLSTLAYGEMLGYVKWKDEEMMPAFFAKGQMLRGSNVYQLFDEGIISLEEMWQGFGFENEILQSYLELRVG